tara:strand:- start:1296 stop:1472 length:177 start_codon:yes stop_codon:yes gene_type:complete
MIDFEHGLLLGIIGCTATIVGFFIAFLVVNKVKRKEREDELRKRENEKNPYYFGDDTV